MFAWLALSSALRAVVPAPDGGYPSGNTAEGQNALLSLTTGGYNTAVGFFSLSGDATNSFNTAIGAATLLFNTADSNTATGAAALLRNTTGNDNVADGAFALLSNTTGGGNTAVGFNVLRNNNGCCNTGAGWSALVNNTTGVQNTAAGVNALATNSEGNNNSGFGWGALLLNQIGNNNTAVGLVAGHDITGNFNICIGSEVRGIAGENNTIRIGDNLPNTPPGHLPLSACYIGGIYSQPADPATVTSVGIDVNGKLGTNASSRRFKRDIKPMEKLSEAILALKPVTFHYKSDAKSTRCFGLIAEQVAEINPHLVIYDPDGKPYTVRYDAVNAMLLNEFLKEHKRVEEQQASIAQLKSTVAQQQESFAQQQAQIQALASGLQKVSAQIEINKRAPKIVVNTP